MTTARDDLWTDGDWLDEPSRRRCMEVSEQMDADAALAARVRRRHHQLGASYLDLHPDSTVDQARRAGRRGMFLALLLESGAGLDGIEYR